MTGTKLKRPPTPHSEAVEEVSVALSEALARALEDAGEGPRERQSAASRVFRVWRSDEAEQRLRELAIRAYQQGVEKSVATLDDRPRFVPSPTSWASGFLPRGAAAERGSTAGGREGARA